MNYCIRNTRQEKCLNKSFMSHSKRNTLVFTVKDRCKVCYTCVRECPAKAIRIINGQAEVISERCIGCGNCVNVCNQGAKIFLDSRSEVKNLIDNSDMVIACIAPSFPAEFSDIQDYKILVGMIKELGFRLVIEVAFGADMITDEYKNQLICGNGKTYISSDCPAIVNYIEHYHPTLVERLSPIASPMVATARIIRRKYGNAAKVVFIGPCIAKKAESEEVDEALTFKELREMFSEYKITADTAVPSEFDPPHPGAGAIFPVSRGLLQNVGKGEDIIYGDTIVASGKTAFKNVIEEYENGNLKSKNLELLCCEGCIMGPGMTSRNKHFLKQEYISRYVKRILDDLDINLWLESKIEFETVNYSQTFQVRDRRLQNPENKDVIKVLSDMGKIDVKDHLNCGACGYGTCIEHAIAIVHGLAEHEMCLPFTIEKLHSSIENLNESSEQLANTQQALKHSEKLANMGQLSAGIAHELNNPLGVITMYSNILKEETPPESPFYSDLQLIVEQAERCKKIVGGLLNFARKNQIKKEEVNILKFVSHSLESIVLPDTINVQVFSEITESQVMLDADQFMQVLTNLEKNACEAMPDGGTVHIGISEDNGNAIIRISDDGIGIPSENMDKLFTPFFTTKEPGKGTGLGLPLVYGIIKMHNGQIQVESNADKSKGKTGTTFILTIPKY